jgi:hypothetical protein
MTMHNAMRMAGVMQEKAMGSYQWVVRGVDQELAKRLVDRAARQNRKAGELLNEALKAYLDQSDDTAPTGTTSALETRIMALEARVEEIATSQARLETTVQINLETAEQGMYDLHQKPADARLDAVKPVEASDIPVPTEPLPEPQQKQQKQRRKNKPWTEADYAVLRRTHDEGRTQADAARELDRPSSEVSVKWRMIGLPVMQRKGRTVTRRRFT